MKVYKLERETGTGHKNDKVYLLGLFGAENVVVTREQLKTAIVSKKVCVVNMKVTKNNRLVKVEDKVAWLNVRLVSYDVNNGICEVQIQSDELDQVNEFISGIERKVITEGCTDRGCVYGYKEGNAQGVHDIIIRWVHIDQVVRTLKTIPHKFGLGHLLSARNHENFAYMTDEQFGNLVDYLRNNLNCKG